MPDVDGDQFCDLFVPFLQILRRLFLGKRPDVQLACCLLCFLELALVLFNQCCFLSTALLNPILIFLLHFQVALLNDLKLFPMRDIVFFQLRTQLLLLPFLTLVGLLMSHQLPLQAINYLFFLLHFGTHRLLVVGLLRLECLQL